MVIVMNITIKELEIRLAELKNEYLDLEGQLSDNPQQESALFDKMMQLSHRIDVLEHEIDKRS